MTRTDPGNILISRTDAIGDVVLTLPMAGVLKKYFPHSKIIFFGRTYTEPIVRACMHVDGFVNYDLFLKADDKKDFLKKTGVQTIVHVFPRKDIAIAAKQAGITVRIGTSHRLYHWATCNHKMALGRKNSNLHEAQLNLALLQPLGIENNFSLEEISSFYGLEKIDPLPKEVKDLVSKEKFNLIMHPKSHASAREWSLSNYRLLAEQLPADTFRVFITGTEKEKSATAPLIEQLGDRAIDMTGRLNLDELISFINACDGLIAASTGPLHIAAALKKFALGIYPPIRPQHPGRWAPIGQKAAYLVTEKSCSDCRNSPANCSCMDLITPQMALSKIISWQR